MYVQKTPQYLTPTLRAAMSQHPPTPPGITGYDENSTIPEHAIRDPGIDPLHGVELGKRTIVSSLLNLLNYNP